MAARCRDRQRSASVHAEDRQLSGDRIVLDLPRDRPFFRIAHLVLGGLAVRLDLTFEHLEDLQLALASVLERSETEEEFTLRLRIDDGEIAASLGPLDERVRRDLEHPAGDDVGLRRVLETVVDRIEVAERDGSQWVELRKQVA